MLDTHQHFWSRSNSFTQWPTSDLHPIYRDFEPTELAKIIEACGVSQTILVQAAPDIAETWWCLKIAEEQSFVAGVVGWIDFEAADAVDQLDSIASHPKLVGLRPMLQSIAKPGWVLQDAFDPIFKRMLDRGLCFDGLVLNSQIGELSQMAARYPELPIVLDHGGKPPIQENRFDAWADEIRNLARHEQVVCKLSGLWTEAGEDVRQETLQPWVDHILHCFGSKRVMWGSDWPVVNLAGTYGDWLKQCRNLLSTLSDEQIASVMSGNGRRFYGI